MNAILSNHYKINEIFNKFILAGDKFVPEMHLKQPEFAYIFVDHLIKIDKEFKIWRNRRFKRYLQKWTR